MSSDLFKLLLKSCVAGQLLVSLRRQGHLLLVEGIIVLAKHRNLLEQNFILLRKQMRSVLEVNYFLLARL